MVGSSVVVGSPAEPVLASALALVSPWSGASPQGERGSEALALVILPQPVVREATVVDGVLIEPDPALPPKLRPRLAYKLSTFRRRDGAVVPVTLWVDARNGEVLRTLERTPFRCGLPDPLDSP